MANGYRDARRSTARSSTSASRRSGRAPGRLEVPGEGILCPFTTTAGAGDRGRLGGCELVLDARSPASSAAALRLQTARGPISALPGQRRRAAQRRARRDAGHGEFTVTPRRGELIVFDKLARGLVNTILLPVPTAKTKGVLVSPTVYGNVLLGPTADDVARKEDRSTTAAGLASLLRGGRAIVPSLLEHEVTATYVGLRAATEDSRLPARFHPPSATSARAASARPASPPRWRSPSASARPRRRRTAPRRRARESRAADAEHRRVGAAPLPARRADRERSRLRQDRLLLRAGHPGRDRARLREPVPPADLDGLRRRTRALMGRCQGFFCAPTSPRLAGRRATRWRSLMGRRDRRRRALGPRGSDRAAAPRARRGRDRARARAGRDPPPLRPQRLRHPRPARVLSGPALRRALRRAGEEAGVELLDATMVTGWEGGRRLS